MKKEYRKSIEELSLDHTPEAIQQRLEVGPRHSYLKDFVYGSVDGAVTTFAVVSGVAGAGLSSHIIIILGLANLIGDGFSMAVSNYLGTRAEKQVRDQARRIEEMHIEKIPDGEKEEVRQIFSSKGFAGDNLDKIVEIITSDKKLWVETMLTEEHGAPLGGSSAIRAALTTFTAFIAVGSMPLLAFLFGWMFPSVEFDPYLYSTVMTGIAFLTVGAFKSRFVGQRWYWASLETFAAGSVAALLAYGVGVALKGIVSA